jgi:hypothetical protein
MLAAAPPRLPTPSGAGGGGEMASCWQLHPHVYQPLVEHLLTPPVAARTGAVEVGAAALMGAVSR